MLRRKIRKLQETQLDLLQRLNSIHDADADPNVKAIYQSDLQYRLVCIEQQIEFELKMLPFAYTLVGFVVAIVCMIIYLVI